MDDLFNEFGYETPEGEREIVMDDVGAHEYGFNLGPFEEDQDDQMADTSTGVLLQEILLRHPECMILLVPPKKKRYSFFVTNHNDNRDMMQVAGEAMRGWAEHLGMCFDFEVSE
jgi:hypothetical protein